MKFSSLLKLGAAALCLNYSAVFASGMVPEAPITVIDQAIGEATMNVLNTDSTPLLLVTNLQNIDDDNITNLLSLTPPAARVEPGKKQLVRFIMTEKTPLKTEHLGRVTFEGIPPQNKGENVVRMSIRQNLPVLIRPAGVPKDETPWKRLTWKQKGNQLIAVNDSPYVIRFSPEVTTLPDNARWTMPLTYILPGKSASFTLEKGKSASSAISVRIIPTNTWGFSEKAYDAPVAR
ncbi:fimbria/pilus chaperone family protein [Pantoea sp. Taur]|uniref:fimbria/pilus chaperone family protein n=1 Tax=Pantoea sp. Taur TaxID=2576757 RepID=UPI00135244A3|nr:fimbria/pilus chaperone family protein [Pantoea sp. Taur]MXP57130.1 fimbrial protein [Pantoea sp. Taur]